MLFRSNRVVTLAAFALSFSSSFSQAAAADVSPAVFCGQVQKIFSSSAIGDQRARNTFATSATQTVMKKLQSGSFDEYYEVTAVGKESSWLSVPEVLVKAMGADPRRVLMVSDINDLKMVPHVAPRSQLLVLASSLGELNPERARLVSEAARANQLKLHVIWTGNSQVVSSDIEVMRMLAQATSGAFLNLSGGRTCSGL